MSSATDVHVTSDHYALHVYVTSNPKAWHVHVTSSPDATPVYLSIAGDPTATQVYVVNPEALQKPSTRLEKQPPQRPNTAGVLGTWNQKLFRIEDIWSNRRDLDDETKRREMAKACIEEGRALLESSSPTWEERVRQLLEAGHAFEDADLRFYRDQGTLQYIKGSEDDVAETRYQRGRVAEELVEIGAADYGFEGPRH